jgi:nascent polypeptide-associated complex subunit beta
MPFSCRAK